MFFLMSVSAFPGGVRGELPLCSRAALVRSFPAAPLVCHTAPAAAPALPVLRRPSPHPGPTPTPPGPSLPWTSLQSSGQGGGPSRGPVRPPLASLCPWPSHGCTPTCLAPRPGEMQATPQAQAVLPKGHLVRVWGEGSGPTVSARFSGASPWALRGAGILALPPGTQRSKDVNELETQNPRPVPARW